MPVAAIAMYATPAYFKRKMPAIAATRTQQPIGVPVLWFTCDKYLEPGSWRSRDMPNASRIVDASIDRQQTKIATDTTSRYATESAFDRFASMMSAGPSPPF